MKELDEIRARVADCRSYNFGMGNADKLAHEDAPRLIAALDAVNKLCDDAEEVMTVIITDDYDRLWIASVRSVITSALAEKTK